MKYDLLGQRFGRLTAIEEAGKDKHGSILWRCKCDCGNECVVVGYSLRRGDSKSCGCLQRELARQRHETHGDAKTRLYKAYDGIKYRCLNKNAKAYPRYGGRGITMCDEWLESFEAFRDWAVSNGYRDDLTIDRIDVNGNYEPNNCRWVSMKVQQRNRRNNSTYKGKCISEWAEITGIKKVTIQHRLYMGWSWERAISEPVRKVKRREK